MRKVVDSNMLRDELLRDYLRRSPQHLAILTDYAAMEAYKADSLEALRRSMAILAEHPKQVIVLKGSQALCGLSARGPGLQRRMIDGNETRQFSSYIRALMRGTDQQLRRQFDQHVRSAQSHMDRMLEDASTTAPAIALIEKTYTAEELRAIRRAEPYTGPILEKLMTHVAALAREMFATHPKARAFLKQTEDVRNSFIFRAALCGYLLTLRWIAVGGAAAAKPAKLRNDMVDINFAAAATYFDGLLSADQKLISIYEEASFLLANLFVPKQELE